MTRATIGGLGARLVGRPIEEWQLAPHSNNFNLVRLLLSSFVIWSHSAWILNGFAERDEISDLFGHTLASLAVDGFFFVSGFLVSQSLFRQAGVLRFAALRFGRIWPGLAVSLVVTVLVFAAVSGRPLAYLVDGETLRFLIKNLTQIRGHFHLPAITPEGGLVTVNGSLWTIPWELRCYLVLALFYGVAAAARGRVLMVAAVPSVLVCAAWSVALELSPVFPDVSRGAGYLLAIWMRLWGCFSAGILIAMWRDRIAVSPGIAVAAWLVALVEHQWVGTALVAPIAIFTSVLALAFGQRRIAPGGKAVTADWPDFSYGIYIYAFPVMVLVALAHPFASHGALALATFAATLPIAALSWFLVEKPALAMAKRMSARWPQSQQQASAET